MAHVVDNQAYSATLVLDHILYTVISLIFAAHRVRRMFWPGKDLNVKLEGKVEPPHDVPALESSVRDSGDPNPCCAQLFRAPSQRTEERKACAAVVSGASCAPSLLPDFKAASSPCSPLKSPKT